MAVYRFCACVLLVIVAGARAHLPSSSEREALLSKIYEAYAAHNLSYDCFRYSDHNRVAECDCLACVKAQPDFVESMCSFRRVQETYFNEGKAPDFDPNNIWHKICDPKCKSRLPNTCCDPVKGVQMEGDCVTCLPTKDSGSTVGIHESCTFAEQESAVARPILDWKKKYALFMKAMDQAKLSRKCSSYAIARTANSCNCEPCLKSEQSMTTLREKLCEMGRIVRSEAELNRREFWRHNNYFLNFCNFEKCPDIPQECCPSRDDSNEEKFTYPVDSRGCPSCLPTTSLLGFGAACERKFLKLSPANRDRILSSF